MAAATAAAGTGAMPATTTAAARAAESSAVAAPAAESAAVPAENDPRWRPALGLPCQLAIELPLPHFKVADFLRLRPGSIVPTGWRLSRDVPLRVNQTLVGWGEFEGAGKRLAVRVTELA